MTRIIKKQTIRFSLPHPSSSELRGRQSVRATFKLSEKAIEAISVVSLHLGIKQKSLFDHLFEDDESLGTIARKLGSSPLSRSSRIQKTYVLSRRTLSCLEKACRDFSAPRDALVEYSIQRLLPVIQAEKEKHRRRVDLLAEIENYRKQGESLYQKAVALLGPDDPVTERLESAVATTAGISEDIRTFIQKSEIIERF